MQVAARVESLGWQGEEKEKSHGEDVSISARTEGTQNKKEIKKTWSCREVIQPSAFVFF
jgi:hypothetical protein